MDIINIKLIDEIAMVFFWVGSNGLLEKIISWPSIRRYKMYIYAILLLCAIYFKL
jgi:hypothetical protein